MPRITFSSDADAHRITLSDPPLNILDIPILKITQQYMEYIGLMADMRLELAADLGIHFSRLTGTMLQGEETRRATVAMEMLRTMEEAL